MIIGEVLEKRTENAKHYRLLDGSFQAMIFQQPIHYVDQHGNWQNFEVRLFDEAELDLIDFPVAADGLDLFEYKKEIIQAVRAAGNLDRERCSYQALKLPFAVKLPRDWRKGYTVGSGAHRLTFKPVNASPSRGYIDEHTKRSLCFQDAWNDTDVHLEVNQIGIKETIVLKTPMAPAEFSFEVTGDLADDFTAGTVAIEKSWLVDAAGVRKDVPQTIRRAADGTVYLDMEVDITGLTYPITVDPSVTIGSTTSNVSAVSTAEAQGTNTMTWTNTTTSATAIMFGYTNTLFYDRSIIKFDLSTIPAGVIVTSATYSSWHVGGNSGSPGLTYPNIFVKRAGAWSSGGAWPMFYEDGDAAVGSNWSSRDTGWNAFSGDVTKMVKQWVENGLGNYGFTLDSSSAGTPNVGSGQWGQFAVPNYKNTTNNHQLVVNYELLPSAPTVTYPNGGETLNALHSITWTGATDQSRITIGTTATYASSNMKTGDKAAQAFTTPNDATFLDYVQFAGAVPNGSTGYDLNVDLYNVDSSGKPTTLIKSFGRTANATAVAGNYNIQFTTKYALAPNTRYALVITNNATANWSQYETSNFSNETYIQVSGGSWSTVGYSWSLYFSLTTDSSQLQYQIDLSKDNATNWKTLVALTAAGANSYAYDFTNEAQTSTALIRIRAYDGVGYGPWDQSNGVFTIQHNTAPTAPTNLAPASNAAIDRATIQRLSWKHNDPQNDPQSKFDLQWRLQGSSTWNTVTISTTNQYWDAPANTFPRGTIEWQVRTYDQAGLLGPYSAQQVFFAGDKPTAPVLIDPTSGAVVNVAHPVVQWSSPDQAKYQAQALTSTGETYWDSAEQASANKAVTVDVALANNTPYNIRVRIKNPDGIYSDWTSAAVQVSYTPPALPVVTPTAEAGCIRIGMNNPVPTGTQPAVQSHDLFRRQVGEATWSRIATNLPPNGTYKDFAARSGKQYEYMVRAVGANGTASDSMIVTASVTLKSVWLHDVADPAGTIREYRYDSGQQKKRDWTAEAQMHQFIGRKRKVAFFGESAEEKISLQLDMTKASGDLDALQALAERLCTVCYRDSRGRKIFGVITGLPDQDQFYGSTVTFDIYAVDFKEEM